MKLEIEITEEELRSAFEQKVRSVVAEQVNAYNTDSYIREVVKTKWKGEIEDIVAEMLYNSQPLREKIANELQRKLRLQLAAVLKLAGDK